MKEIINSKFTPEQTAAISHRGSSLLVSSAAGSGKTMVLVERLLKYVVDDKQDIDKFLIITYTRAAAAELRERIYHALQKRLADNPGNNHLRRQSMLCKGANIDTIHTFCNLILRENAHLVDMPADFRIADENECAIIKDVVLDEVFSRTYDKIDELQGLSELIEMFTDGRDDKKLSNMVKHIHTRLMSVPNPDLWIKEQTKKYECGDINDIYQTQYGRYLMNSLHRKVEHCICKLIAITKDMKVYPDFSDAYGANINAYLNGMQQLSDALMNSWDMAVELSDIVAPRVKNIKSYDELKRAREWCLKQVKDITKNLNTRSVEHINDMKRMYPIVKALFDIVLDYHKSYNEEKKKRGIMDFSDLEHITLSLLYDYKLQRKTPFANSISNRFSEIMIDEYQDVNEVQEMLFKTLSKDESNIFMVGDVKQSIYRFRLAEPTIFIRKYKEYRDYSIPKLPETRPDEPVKINLSMNFRSKKCILDAVNHIFYKIMSENFGEMKYTDDEALIAGRISDEERQGKKGKPYLTEQRIAGNAVLDDIGDAVEIVLISMGSLQNDDEESPVSAQIEAEYIAGKIKQLLDSGYKIKDDDGKFRKIRCSDIAILSRSVKGKSWRYASELSKIGIESDLSGFDDYFATGEVQTILNFLSVIDNPMQDIALASVLSGPIYEFTSDELAQIRVIDKSITYYEALKRTAKHEKGSRVITDKARKVLDDIEKMRLLAYEMPADRFIWSVYNTTGILKKVYTMKNGAYKRNNLIALAEFAQKYEAAGFKGLFSFISFIMKLQERGADISQGFNAIDILTGARDAVKILSIHKSKGLEFPIVFLADTAKRHNLTDVISPVVFHKDLGIGCQITDVKRRIRYNTLAKIAISDKLKSELLSEELRVLYVAMTRAKEKLIITGVYNDAVKQFDKIKMLEDTDGTYSPQALMSMNSISDWILAGASDADENLIKINVIDSISCDTGDFEIAEGDDDNIIKEETDSAASAHNIDLSMLEFNYHHISATKLPSKLTVTELKSVAEDDSDSSLWDIATPENFESTPAKHKKPKFISKSNALTGTEKGTIMHEIIRYIDYNKCSSDDEIRRCIEMLVKSMHLSERAMDLSNEDINMITTLFKSSLGARLLNAVSVTREFRYSLLSLANKYFDDCGNDEILIQGVIDCYFEEEGEYIIVDYKTDKIKDTNIKQRTEKYTPQLIEYSEALERITGKKVRERIIYYLSAGIAVSV